jgi:hypothetical protein
VTVLLKESACGRAGDLNPYGRSPLRFPSILRRRPSTALIVSFTALFVSLGGASYAAVTIPNNSVGTPQIAKNAVTNSKIDNGAVTYKKIRPNSVGRVRANLGQLQERVGGQCAAGTAIATVGKDGTVTCNSTLPAGLQTTSNTVAISPTATTPTTITTLALPAGPNYMEFANPTVAVSGATADQRVQVSCTLTVGTDTQTRAATVIGATDSTTDASIPLQLSGPSGASSVACTAKPVTGTLPATSVTASIDALQINS